MISTINASLKITYTISQPHVPGASELTHWGRVTHICVDNVTSIVSDNGLSPDRRQAIIWTNAGLLLIGPLGTNFSEILIEILTFSFKKMHLKVSSAKQQPFCLGLNALNMHWCCTKLAHSFALYESTWPPQWEDNHGNTNKGVILIMSV